MGWLREQYGIFGGFCWLWISRLLDNMAKVLWEDSLAISIRQYLGFFAFSRSDFFKLVARRRLNYKTKEQTKFIWVILEQF